MLSEEQKYEHTCERVQNVIGECEWKIRDMIEQSGLDIDTTDLYNHFEALKSNIEIMMESS
jgi:hypothetical protein|tara:strand:- start:614 stop:796 length:183 start_codon:yes stop_codon:yes gene_type:complete